MGTKSIGQRLKIRVRKRTTSSYVVHGRLATVVYSQGDHQTPLPRGTIECLTEFLDFCGLVGRFSTTRGGKKAKMASSLGRIVVMSHSISAVYMKVHAGGGKEDSLIVLLKQDSGGGRIIPPSELFAILRDRQEAFNAPGKPAGISPASEGKLAPAAAGLTVDFFRTNPTALAWALHLALDGAEGNVIPCQKLYETLVVAADCSPNKNTDRQANSVIQSALVSTGYLSPVDGWREGSLVRIGYAPTPRCEAFLAEHIGFSKSPEKEEVMRSEDILAAVRDGAQAAAEIAAPLIPDQAEMPTAPSANGQAAADEASPAQAAPEEWNATKALEFFNTAPSNLAEAVRKMITATAEGEYIPRETVSRELVAATGGRLMRQGLGPVMRSLFGTKRRGFCPTSAREKDGKPFGYQILPGGVAFLAKHGVKVFGHLCVSAPPVPSAPLPAPPVSPAVPEPEPTLFVQTTEPMSPFVLAVALRQEAEAKLEALVFSMREKEREINKTMVRVEALRAEVSELRATHGLLVSELSHLETIAGLLS